MQARSANNIKGIDVSHWQGKIDWAKVKAAGIQVAYLKATEGTTHVDKMLKTNYQNAKKAGIKVGFYHFFRAKNEQNAREQARHFVNTVKGMPNDLKHALDIETTEGLSNEALTKCAIAFLEEVKKLTGQDPIVYTYTSFARSRLTAAIAKYPVWIAHYGVDKPGDNPIWDRWIGFQYTDKGKVSGIAGNVDMNEFTSDIFVDAAKVEQPKQKVDAVQSTPSATGTYTIKSGDTFWELEEKYNWPHGTLQRLNPSVNPNALKVGQVIKVPKSEQPKQNASSVTGTYTIKSGDTFWDLEQKNGWPHGTLQKLNPGVNPNKLKVGQVIKVPKSEQKNVQRTVKNHQKPNYRTYKIKKGDTFWELEKKNGWPHGTLQKLNPGVNPAKLQIGQTIKIPN
ncbi:endolysin [Geobacillus phage TP-84]|uniref:lysozyme n=1 Tax=Geobacillus phage TP-84 TaxID=1965361 RepID=A0A1U9WQS3_9CAUD|nr:endolysin [Geobacillus phage TP-84]AQY55126.1 endolysin [Geobacillus phage TP-84]